MPKMVPDLLTSWTGLCGKKEHAEIWVAIFSCLMCTKKKKSFDKAFQAALTNQTNLIMN